MPKGRADPQVLFDYRCYLPDGKEEIGTDYPPQIKQCLTKISGMTVQVMLGGNVRRNPCSISDLSSEADSLPSLTLLLQEVKQHYGFTEDHVARNLWSRATGRWALNRSRPGEVCER